jgi:hypothetical protein
MEIVELCSAAERREALPILRELYASLDEDRYAGLLAEMVVDGYRQFALRNETAEIVALAGWPSTSTSTMGVTSTSTI